MADERKTGTRKGVLVACRRLGQPRTVTEHLSCPYCYGGARQVATGDRSCFCDFDPEHDATVFGFPETAGHFAKG